MRQWVPVTMIQLSSVAGELDTHLGVSLGMFISYKCSSRELDFTVELVRAAHVTVLAIPRKVSMPHGAVFELPACVTEQQIL